MSYPPQPNQPGGYPEYPGGYNPPPGIDPNYGPPSGPQPGYGQGYPQQPQQPQYPVPHPGYQQHGYGQPGYGQPGYGQPGERYTPTSDERTMALAAHLGGVFTTFVLPLIIYLVKKDESPFLRHQAAQAFNFQVTMAIGQLVSAVLMIILIGFVTWIVVIACALIFGIMASVAANKGEWYTYPPLAIPMLK